MSKRGKEFIKHDTTHAEDIKHIYVKSSHIWSCGEYVLACYESSGGLQVVNKYFYTCEDKINDIIVEHVAGQGFLNPILACRDK